MPRVLLDFRGYVFYFYSREDGEPIHVHVSKGKQSENCAKFWIKRDCVELAHNNGKIPKKDLKLIYEYICNNREEIVFTWYQYFGM